MYASFNFRFENMMMTVSIFKTQFTSHDRLLLFQQYNKFFYFEDEILNIPHKNFWCLWALLLLFSNAICILFCEKE